MWPSILMLLVSQVSYTVSRAIFFENGDIYIDIASSFICLIQLIFYCLVIHIVMTWIG